MSDPSYTELTGHRGVVLPPWPGQGSLRNERHLVLFLADRGPGFWQAQPAFTCPVDSTANSSVIGSGPHDPQERLETAQVCKPGPASLILTTLSFEHLHRLVPTPSDLRRPSLILAATLPADVGLIIPPSAKKKTEARRGSVPPQGHTQSKQQCQDSVSGWCVQIPCS